MMERLGYLVKLVLILTILAFVLSTFVSWPLITDRGSRMLRTKAHMKGLEIAVKSYKTEYLRLPSPTPDATADNPPIDSTSTEGIALLNILTASNEEGNPKHIRFWDPPPSKNEGSGFTPEKGLIDRISKRGFKIILDYNGDGQINDPTGGPTPISSDVIIYCAGSDGDFSTWKDNVCSWK